MGGDVTLGSSSGSTTSATLEVANGQDPSGITVAQIKGAFTFTDDVDGSIPATSVTVDTSGLSATGGTITVTATDSAGNTQTVTITVTIASQSTAANAEIAAALASKPTPIPSSSATDKTAIDLVIRDFTLPSATGTLSYSVTKVVESTTTPGGRVATVTVEVSSSVAGTTPQSYDVEVSGFKTPQEA